MFNRDWRTGSLRVGKLVRVEVGDNSRVGHCWMAGRLKDGDLLLAYQHSGDCFWKYKLLEGLGTYGDGKSKGKTGFRAVADVAGYSMGIPTRAQPTAREYHLLMAGEEVALDVDDESCEGWMAL